MADLPDTAMLDRSVANSERFIAETKAALIQQLHDQGDAADPWLREISQVELKRKPPKVIIGVVGATGSGKSSIINAVLGETQLVPTNCMRACTAVVTEISWNDDPTNYRAKIEFVSRREWQDELQLLLGDIVTGGKVTANINDDNSEAGIAFAKVQAVYPHLNRNNLAQANADELLACDYIKEVVGTEIEFSTSTADELHNKIQKYVDSKEKLAEDYAQHGLGASSALDEIAYWPLIRTVKIYTRAEALKSGSVLVDLPGVADSNAARASIAQKYLQNCAALWIVAPIIRAVDDKSARFLLNEGFKRQLWRDGTLQRLTFICSKTDEISISEARAALQRYPQYKDKFAKVDQDKMAAVNERDSIQDSLLEVKQKIATDAKLHKEAMLEEEHYKTLSSQARAGQSVYPLIRVEVNKRRGNEEVSEASASPLKKTKYDVAIAASFQSPGRRPAQSFSNTGSKQVQFREDTTKACLTTASLKNKLDALKERKRDLKAAKRVSRETEKQLLQARTDNKAQIAEIGANEWIACVLGRNEISAHAIRLDFAAGLRDLAADEKTGDDEDEEPEMHDDNFCEIENVAQEGPSALPVFCVSAKGYYKLSGLMEDEKIAACFDTAEDTGIPALRNHVFKLGHARQVASLQSYVDEAQRLLTSLRLWSSGDTAARLTEKGAVDEDEEFCLGLVEDLISGILLTANSVMDAIKKIVDSEVLAALPVASKSACNTAVLTVMQWVASRKSNPPGLHWGTFRAVIRRSGTFTNLQKTHDFNTDLLQPFMRSIDARWNDTFNVQVDKEFRRALKSSADGLDKFAEPFGDRLGPSETDSPGTIRQLFDEQVKLFTKSLGAVFKKARKSIEDHQKEANRLFEESVKTQMKNIYTELEAEKGNGFYDRCKEKLKVYVDHNKDVMFDKVSRRIKEKLQKMLEDVRGALLLDLQSTCDSLERDCRYLCQRSRDFVVLPEAAQKAIIQVLGNANVMDVVPDAMTGDQAMSDVGGLADLCDQNTEPYQGHEHSLVLRSDTPMFEAGNQVPDWSDGGKSESDSDDESDGSEEDEE